MISNKSSTEIVTIKGCFSGLGSLIIALASGENIPNFQWICAALSLGFVAYGLSINFYIMAQKHFGAAKTSAFYSIAPFLGVMFSMLLGERPSTQFYIALLIMMIGTVLMIRDTVSLQHTHMHAHIHTHEHCHGDLIHTHEHCHEHSHLHIHEGDSETHTHEHNDLSTHDHLHIKTE